MELIKTEHLSRSFTIGALTHQILTDISMTIQQGEFLSVIGKSGSGKTTLMNILGCLDRPSSGSYFLERMEVSKLTQDQLAAVRNNKIGFIFQTFNLLDDLTALDNVALPILYSGATKKQSREKAQKQLEELDLSDRLLHYPKQLSGGQRQRVAIARALINQPSLILADEPTGNLDSKTGAQTMAIFKKLNEEKGITFVIVTHDREIAHQTQRTIQLIDGKIVSQ